MVDGQLNVTSTFKVLPVAAVAGSPIAVGQTQVAMGGAVQEFMISQGYAEVCPLCPRARPVSRLRRSQICADARTRVPLPRFL